jgi:hypothetical protein
MVDFVRNPTHYCQEHGEWYYFHCRKCFAPHGDEPTPLRVKPVQVGSEQASEDTRPQRPKKQRHRRRK